MGFERLTEHLFRAVRHGRIEVEHASGRVALYGEEGRAPSARMTIRDARFYRHVVLFGEVGFGEAYTQGWFDTDEIGALLAVFIRNVNTSRAGRTTHPSMNALGALNQVRHLVRSRLPHHARSNIEYHYDLGNAFFELWLDPTMTYSLGLFLEPADTLVQAQCNKLKSVCVRLGLAPGMRLLDVGCGWGALPIFAASHYDCDVVGLTLSPSQASLARERVQRLGLQHRVEIRLCDFDEVDDVFDAVASLGVLPHVGKQRFGEYLGMLSRSLAPGGTAVLDSVLAFDSDFEDARRNPSWTAKHIFPGGMLPSIGFLARELASADDLQIFHVESCGVDYGRTMGLWHDRFVERLDAIRALGYPESFLRTWSYWLAGGAANFAARGVHAAQIVLGRRRVPGTPDVHTVRPYGVDPGEDLARFLDAVRGATTPVLGDPIGRVW